MSHPSHKAQLASVRRIAGQLRGVEKMIEERQYCVDILNQTKAIRSAISTVEGKILKTHLAECVKGALDRNGDFEEKMEELLKVLKR